MSPFDLNQASVIPAEEQERDHTCSSFSSATAPNFFDQRIVDYNRLVHHLQHPVQQDQHKKLFHLVSAGSQDPDSKTLHLSLRGTEIGEDEEEEEPPERPGKWMPSKMRFMRKMMSSARIPVGKPGEISSGEQEGEEYPGRETSSQIISSSSSPGGANGVIRVCSDCSTTKTPLWRSGPRGPKSLCNACGIRQRKARRAMAAATLNGGLVIPRSAAAYKVRKERKLDIDIDRTLPFKKRCKVNTMTTDITAATGTAAAPNITSTPAKKLCFDEALTSSSRSKNSATQKVFLQEERDAAILLMTLSCGLIRS